MYQSIYKCRLCGEETKRNITDESEVNQFNWYVYEGGTYNIKAHTCLDGSLGISDFQGYRKVGIIEELNIDLDKLLNE